MENVRAAHEKAQKGKRHYQEIRRVNRNLDAYMENLHRMLAEKKYRTSPYKVETRSDTGKQREIYVLPYYPDRIVHHCIMAVVEPIWQRTLIRDTYSAIKGRGIHDGQRRLRGFLKDKAGTKYCLKMDVKKFYPSIRHGALKQIIRKKIKCRDTLMLLDEIIESAPGVPIGNYLSQYLGNLYLSPFDHWVKSDLRMPYYARYCDDIVILDASKPRLHEVRKQAAAFLQDRLGLQVKENWQVFPTAVRGIDFLGYRSFPDYTLVRKSIARRFKRAMAQIRRRPTRTSVNRVMSYYGWFKYADAKRLWGRHVDGRVSVQIEKMCQTLRQHNPLKDVS